MNSRDLFSLCFGNLMRRKTRTILAIIGVVVGTCAIIVMLSIGFGLSASYRDQIESFGNLHTIQVYNYGGGGRQTNGKTVTLDDASISRMGKINGVTAITPIMEQYLVVGIGHMVAQVDVYGIDPSTMEKFGYEVSEGRLLNSTDKNAIVFGKYVASWFYNPKQQRGSRWDDSEPTVDVITNDIVLTGDWSYGTNDEGQGEIHYETFKAEGVGLLAAENDESAYRAYMNIETLKNIQISIQKSEGQQPKPGQATYQQALIYVDDISKVRAICDTIKDEFGFQTYSLTEMLDEVQKTMSMIQGILGGIGAISLLVAAIGIANTMIMSVYERTREIGVMKVIGASFQDIRTMFLIEAGMIGFAGGVLGVGLSYLISLLMNTVLQPVLSGFLSDFVGNGSTISVIPAWVALGALAFATLIGILSGYAPAKRAMNLSALEGLKNE